MLKSFSAKHRLVPLSSHISNTLQNIPLNIETSFIFDLLFNTKAFLKQKDTGFFWLHKSLKNNNNSISMTNTMKINTTSSRKFIYNNTLMPWSNHSIPKEWYQHPFHWKEIFGYLQTIEKSWPTGTMTQWFWTQTQFTPPNTLSPSLMVMPFGHNYIYLTEYAASLTPTAISIWQAARVISAAHSFK